MTPERRAFLLKETARGLGFASCGITDLTPPPHAGELDAWLRNGMAATMGYLPRQAARRKEPARIVAGATHAIMVTRCYPAPDDPGSGGREDQEPSGRVARYARGRDYHDALRPDLEALAARVRELGDANTLARYYVDAGPVPERELAQRAGLGWIGKNTMLIDPARGSYSFIASVLTDLPLAVDPPFESDRCGSCRRCLDACPTDAFPAPRVLDARRCISYLTIEYRGEALPPSLVPDLDGWIFGCDVCQEVCPWNVKFADDEPDPTLAREPPVATVPLDDAVTMTDEEFARRFGDTALSRTGPGGLRRNARALRDATDRSGDRRRSRANQTPPPGAHQAP